MVQSINMKNEKDIVQASGKVVTGNGTLPHRIVLRDDGEQFITHREILNISVSQDGRDVVFSHAAYEEGNYFNYKFSSVSREDALKEARADFNERAGRL